MNAVKYLAAALLLALFSGCSSPPVSRDLQRQAKQVTFHQVRADPEGTSGTVVIWGGRIINVANDTNGSSIYIVGLPVSRNGSPARDGGTSPGRFIAASPNFLDPEMFPPGARITIAGQLDGVSTEQLGDMNYTYPVLDIIETHIWPERQSNPNSTASRASWNVYMGPAWGAPGWGPGPYWGPGWGPYAYWGPGWGPGPRRGPGWGRRSGFHGNVHVRTGGGGGRRR